INFYKQTLGAEVMMLMRYKESPAPPPGLVPHGCDEKVMHASFRVGDSTILASDGQCTGQTTFRGISLSLTVPNDVEAERIFNALVQGGHVQMPLVKTFFSSRFGMVADRFGVSWMVLVAP